MDDKRQVVFVCEHGSAKSVVAAAHFNRLARERLVELVAVARGTSPDGEIAPRAAEGLAADGLAPDGGTPQRLTASDVDGAVRLVAFGPLSEAYGRPVGIEIWEEVPPVSEDYARARDRILERLERLFDELAEPGSPAGGAPVL
jgi:arsenate reductase (thioredoxin)